MTYLGSLMIDLRENTVPLFFKLLLSHKALLVFICNDACIVLSFDVILG
jgi:hypothetical protein